MQTNIQRKGIADLSPNVSASDFYIPRSAFIRLQVICGPILGIYNMNVEIGTEAGAIPFLGIHKWDFRCSES